MRLVVIETAGIEKTYLIKTIQSRLQKIKEAKSESLIIMLTSTGVVAFNINRITVYSRLSIPIINDSKYIDIKGEQLK